MQKLWLALAAALFVVVVAAGAAQAERSGGYPTQVATEVEQFCLASNSSSAECSCFVSRVQATVPFTEFVGLRQALSEQRLHPALTRWVRAMGECAAAQAGPTALPGSGYTDQYVRNFFLGCGEGAPLAYCQCVSDWQQRAIPFESAVDFDYLSAWGRSADHPRHAEYVNAYQACSQQHWRAKQDP